MPMRAEVKEKWLDALESGEVKQGRGHLHDLKEDTYCCLGVLCSIAADEGVVSRMPSNVGNLEQFTGESGPSVGLLPRNVMRWAGMVSTDGTFLDENNNPTSLASQNDSGATFDEIAQMIREYF